ncbi:hypothetical protein, partial [Peribacillus sp.]|uniref:hypothetical protein n=1 Tax=Peribacillus sp. TaxID=2675267 RepID=UPI00388F9E1B
AMAHNLLKIAGLRQLLSVNYYRNRKTGGEKQLVFLHLFYFRDLLDSPFFYDPILSLTAYRGANG